MSHGRWMHSRCNALCRFFDLAGDGGLRRGRGVWLVVVVGGRLGAGFHKVKVYLLITSCHPCLPRPLFITTHRHRQPCLPAASRSGQPSPLTSRPISAPQGYRPPPPPTPRFPAIPKTWHPNIDDPLSVHVQHHLLKTDRNL